jgi:hypothetical protein
MFDITCSMTVVVYNNKSQIPYSKWDLILKENVIMANTLDDEKSKGIKAKESTIEKEGLREDDIKAQGMGEMKQLQGSFIPEATNTFDYWRGLWLVFMSRNHEEKYAAWDLLPRFCARR